MNPKARRDELLIYEMEDELFVYTLHDDGAHGLNPVAAAVFRACDGSRSVSEIAQVLHQTFEIPQNETLALTALTLDRLTEAGLLEPGYGHAEPTRRELLRRLGKFATVSAALMPVISSITAPTPAMAQSGCLTLGTPCNVFDDQCCPGLTCRAVAGPNTCQP
ncbi:MAG: hypothetical protein ETSY1_23515 [Candidatus Entotheonella factor]|uniref:PqqD family protein n=1 Tax=Entotheonella factor TaxID=1429438 RepID=W4LHM5_ENTF1|nr:MAG: hypothetical protein ETSY1_23515 [Candidatus Entotheonella factor]